MPKRVIIVHGWGGNPQEAWFPWLKQQLEQRGFWVEVPNMPEPDTPKKELWVPHLAAVVGTPDENTYLVGHSMGCQTILRYLERLSEGSRIGGAVLVAGFTTLTGLSPEEEPVAKPWLESPIDFPTVRSRCKRFTAIFSDDDPYVPLSNDAVFRKELNAAGIVLYGRGHMGASDNILQLPEALSAVLDISGTN